MSRYCAVHSCVQQASGYSTYCELHKRNLRRHGHAEQKGVTVFELQPFRERVAARRVKNPANPTWELLERRWEALTAHAGDTLKAYGNGATAISYERKTAEQLVALRDTVAMADVVETALAMVAMGQQRPSRFRSDRAFDFQLARRIRGLLDRHTGSRWSASSGRMKRTYRDTPPRVLECLAASLKIAFGTAGMRLAELDMKEAEGVHVERKRLHDALRELS